MKKFNKLELFAFGMGALVFGIVVYFKFHPDAYLNMIYSIRQKIVKVQNKKEGLSYTAAVYIQPEINEGHDQLKQHAQQVDAILRKRMEQVGYDVELLDMDYAKGILSYHIGNVSNRNALEHLLSARGEIKFYNAYEASEVFSVLTAINDMLREEVKKAPKEKVEDNGDVFDNMVVGDSVVKPLEPSYEEVNPLFEVLFPSANNGQIQEGPLLAYARKSDIAKVNEYLGAPNAKHLYPRYLALCWAAEPFSGDVYGLYAVKTGVRDLILTSKDINTAEQTFEPNAGLPEVSIMLRAGAIQRWADATDYAANQPVKGSIAVICDDKVLTAPRVQTRIDGGRMTITGSDLESSKALAAILSQGVLPNHVILKLN